MSRFQAPRGTRDLLPADAAAFDALAATVLGRAARYGYARIETPAVEVKEVFMRTSGETSDIVSKEMYDVALHGEGGLALRPEGTAPVVRALLQHGLHRAPQPVRLSYLEAMFRGQRPQLGRWRQHWQWGLECFGAADPWADVEIIEFTDGLLKEVGLTKYETRLNTVGDAKCRGKVREALREYFEPFRSELDPDCQRRLDENVLRIFDCKEERDRAIAKGAPRIYDLLCQEDRTHFDDVRRGLDTLGVAYLVDDRLVRGLDYYTRTVVEFHLTGAAYVGRGISVAGGGRYDWLVETLGGPPLPGVGIAGGVDVLLMALDSEEVKLGDGTAPEVYVISAKQDDGADRLQLAVQLRAAGFRVAIDYSRRALDKQLESAVKHGAKVAVIRGTEEARGGHAIVRDLVAREQRVTPLHALVTEVARRLGKPNPRASAV